MGELADLGAAVIWATTNIVLRGQSVRLGAVTVNAWRTLFAALCFITVFLLTRPIGIFATLPLRGVAALLVGVILGMVIGDVLQFTAMTRIGVARAMPISSCFPLFTIVIAAIFLGERITGRTMIGAVLVIAGVVLVALPSRSGAVTAATAPPTSPSYSWVGVAMALTAAVCWSCSTTFSRIALRDIDVITANTIRMPFSAAISLLLSLRSGGLPPREFGRTSLVILILCGIIGTAGGGFLHLTAIDLAGAAKTAILGSAAPIFGLIGSVIFLRERPSPRGIGGALLSVVGIAFVV